MSADAGSRADGRIGRALDPARPLKIVEVHPNARQSKRRSTWPTRFRRGSSLREAPALAVDWRDAVTALADALVDRAVLDGDEVACIVPGHPVAGDGA